MTEVLDELRKLTLKQMEDFASSSNIPGGMNVVGAFFEVSEAVPVGGAFGLGGEGVYFVGYDRNTGLPVEAFYAGVQITAGVSAGGLLPGVPDVFVGAFGFTGDAKNMGGPNLALEAHKGVASVSMSTNPFDPSEILFMGGASSSLGVEFSAGLVTWVKQGQEVVYSLGSRRTLDLGVTEGFVESPPPFVYQNLQGGVANVFVTSYPDPAVPYQLVQKYSSTPIRDGENYVERRSYFVDQDGHIVSNAYTKQALSELGVYEPGSTIGSVTSVEILTDEQLEERTKAAVEPEECFAAGTNIDLSDGSQKYIEDILVNDVLAAYNGFDDLVPARVTRIHRNTVSHVLDLHGLTVTPGHVTLCGDGPFRGRHVPIIDILRSDGAVVDRDGNLIRAATNFPVGSPEDAFVEVWAVSRNGESGLTVIDRQRVRAGTRVLLDDGSDYTLLDRIREAGGTVLESGLVEMPGAAAPGPFLWAIDRIPNPEDYVLARSDLLLEEIYDAGEWEALGPQIAPPDELAAPEADGPPALAASRRNTDPGGGLH